MSKKSPKKKIVIEKGSDKTTKRNITPTVSRTSSKTGTAVLEKNNLIFGKQNYILMGVGAALVGLGMLLMTGGNMPSPDVWDEDIIYGFRRTVLAPFTILAGLVVEIFAIFKD